MNRRKEDKVSSASLGSTPIDGLQSLKGLVDSLEQIRESAVVVREYQKEMANLMHHKYKTLVDAGFSKQEALMIIMNRPEII